MARLPRLPSLLDRKIYKTGQTRGADDDQIFQNRVGRNSTVLIPFAVWVQIPTLHSLRFENGFIVMIPPRDYFEVAGQDVSAHGLEIGVNALVYYERRDEWLQFHPDQYGFTPPTSRTAPLGGQYAARIANTTSANDERINVGFTSTGLKGAGIRLYEYADLGTLGTTRIQLEAVFWHAVDAVEKMLTAGMTEDEIRQRRSAVLDNAASLGLLDYDQLVEARIVNADRELVCPLCLEPISAAGFLSRLPQASGRERHDLTVTEINLFHIQELGYGLFNHRPYNLGWGHHHCNVVCKDSGIQPTLDWMAAVMRRNGMLD
ncbi:BstXI family restriction endonuclease [Roseovarius sp. MBR-6]|uniref:BstXI family restriction endonuclease n=1 Tax=Roseovarius sp. MBR-6 TaxID=3156459 RepID=UPI003394C592